MNTFIDENLIECFACGGYFKRSEMVSRTNHCKPCRNKHNTKLKFLKNLENIIITPEKLLHYFGTTDEMEIREIIANMDDKIINILLKRIMKNKKLTYEQKYQEERYIKYANLHKM